MSNDVVYLAGHSIAPGDLVTGIGSVTGTPRYGRYVGPGKDRGVSYISDLNGERVVVLTGSLRPAV